MGHLILDTCKRVCHLAKHVKINEQAVQKLAESLSQEELNRIHSPASFDANLHYVDRSSPEGEGRTVQYLLVVDALNFCFWPEPGLEYEHLSKGVKAALSVDPDALNASRLAAMTGEGIQALLGRPHPVPLQEERARLVREVGEGLLRRYNGSAAELVRAAQGSAPALVQLVAETFPGFRDHAIYQGHQVFLYKRAQIFVGDVYGALLGSGLGALKDMTDITTFADYRVPVVLKGLGVLLYTPTLDQQIASLQELYPGSEQEVEIRAATVWAVELLREALQKRLPASAPPLLSVTLDWWLWERGEANRTTDPPHHRTLTVYY